MVMTFYIQPQRHNLWKKQLINWTLLNLKLIFGEKECQENENTNHKLGENNCKRTSDKVLIKLCKELLKLNKKVNNSIKRSKDLNRDLIKEYKQMEK